MSWIGADGLAGIFLAVGAGEGEATACPEFRAEIALVVFVVLELARRTKKSRRAMRWTLHNKSPIRR